ncbi:MAG: ABC transporter substrate-binding protein, partial [Ilumatobacteraceae bacterium]
AITLIAAACGGDDDDTTATEAPAATEAPEPDTTEAPEPDTTEAPEPDTTDAPEPDTTDAPEPDGDGDGDAVAFGALLPESGSLAAIVESLRVPIDLAAEEINEAGGVLGSPLEIIGADDGTDDATIASTSFERLVTSDGVDVVLGPASSTLAEGLMSEFAASDIVVCNGSNTSAALQQLDDNGRYFQFAPNDNLQGPALAEVISSDGHGSVAILVRNDTYGTGFGDAIEAALLDLGIDVPFNEAYDPEADSFTAQAEQIRSGIEAGDFEAVVVIGFSSDGGQVIADMIESGVGPADIPIYTGDGMQGSSFWEQVGSDPSLVEGIKGTAPAAAPAGIEHPFQERFAETGVDTIFSSYYYDCAITMALAIESAGSTDVEAIIQGAFDVTSGDTECQGFAECKELLDAGESINVSGASGSLALDEGGAVLDGAYDVWAYNADGEPAGLDEPQIMLSLA